MNETTNTPIPEEGTDASTEDLTEKWGDFLSEDDHDEDAVIDELEMPAPEVEKAPEAEPEAKTEEVTEEVPEPKAAEEESKEPEPPTEEPQAVEQPVEEVVEKPPVEEPQTPTEPVVQRTPEEIEALRTKAQTELRQSYELTSEEAEAMVSEPEKVLPSLAAKVHMQVYEQVMQGMVAQMPQMVKGLMDQDRQVRSHEEAFYG